MKTHILRFAVATLGLLFCSTLAVAQDNNAQPRHSFGCSSTFAESTFNAELHRPSKLQLLPVVDATEIQQAQTQAFHTLFSNIDAAKYKINRVDFYIHHDRPTDSLPYSPLTIYVRLSVSDQALWWKVVELEKEGPELSLLFADLPSPEEENPQSPATILPATGDPTIPSFEMQWSSVQRGTSVAEIEAHILLDLQLPQPHVAADLSCNSIEAFGVCGVWDAQMESRNNYECDWIKADNDFRCEATVWNDRVTKRQTKSWFQLLSGNDIPFSVSPGNPATLQQFAAFAERDPSWRTRQIELPGLGKTSHILRLPVLQNRVIHVFGTYGAPAPFGAWFFYVVLNRDHAAELGYIPSVSLFEHDPEGKARYLEATFENSVSGKQALPTPASEIKLGGELSFGVKQLFTDALTHIYQITAREDQITDGRDQMTVGGNGGRAVYWLAIEDQQSEDRTLFGMTRVASNGLSYVGCARQRTEASAAVITIQEGLDFRALVDVEPSHTSSEATEGFTPPDTENGEKVEDQCAYSVDVEWNHKQWLTHEPKLECGCTFSPREISIADDGSITAKPAQVGSGPN
jgi:hypothetical protein